MPPGGRCIISPQTFASLLKFSEPVMLMFAGVSRCWLWRTFIPLQMLLFVPLRAHR